MSDWWSRKLSGDTTRRPLPYVPQPSHPQVSPPEQPPAPKNTTFAKSQGTCPGCGGDNYFAMGSAQARCYDCGYPIEQQASGLTGNDGGPSKAARQVPSEGYQPQNITGRIG